MTEDFEKALLFLYVQGGNVRDREHQIKLLASMLEWDLVRAEAAFVTANKMGYSDVKYDPDDANENN